MILNNMIQWVDKYRPHRINDIIGHDNIKQMINESIKNKNMPNLLLYGPPGNGKTSFAQAIISQLYGSRVIDNVLELNASDENGINVIRDKIIKYSQFSACEHDITFKTIILDEADSMTSEAQTALKKVMEATSHITRFIIICNYNTKIIDALKSRCANFKFNQISDSLMIKIMKRVAMNENMNINDVVYQKITFICNGDVRKSINTLQNLKYVAHKNNISIYDLYELTSYIDDSFLNQYWPHITTTSICKLYDIVTKIINTGYPMSHLLNSIKDKILKTNLSDKNKSNVIINLGIIERLTIRSANSFIQLYAILTQINTIYRGITTIQLSVF